MLARAAQHVSSDGVVVLSYPTNPPRSRAAALARLTPRLAQTGWRLEEGDVIQRVQGTGLLSYEHRFTREEVEKEVRAAGFYVEYLTEPIAVLKAAAAHDRSHARTTRNTRATSVASRP